MLAQVKQNIRMVRMHYTNTRSVGPHVLKNKGIKRRKVTTGMKAI